MLKEVQSAVDFLAHIISLSGTIPQQQVNQFSECLEKLLYIKFERHWFPQKPFQGSAFRCIRITQKHMDSDIDKAANMSGVTNQDLLKCLPQEFTMWIDPDDVSYRIGEDGSICQLVEEDDNATSSTTSPQDHLSPIVGQTCHSEVSTRGPLVPPQNESTYTQCWS